MSDIWFDLAFYIMALVLLASAAGVVWRTNIVHSALFLVISLATVAGVFVLLHAEFVAAVQILIYVGAVMILLLFAIMMTQRASSPFSNPPNRQSWLAAIIGLAVLAVTVGVFAGSTWAESTEVLPPDTVPVLGKLLFNDYVLPFEAASLLLLAALIGAIVVARED